jgi:hypothetical protein
MVRDLLKSKGSTRSPGQGLTVPLPFQTTALKRALYDIEFVPNPASKNFPYLIGLEACVDKIIQDALRRHPAKDRPAATTATSTPSVCFKCATDFTASWKWTNSSKGEPASAECPKRGNAALGRPL